MISKTILFIGLALSATFAMAQQGPAAKKGSNPNPDAPVNVANPKLRPANPNIKQAIPAKGGTVVNIKNDKPVQDVRPQSYPQQPNLERNSKSNN